MLRLTLPFPPAILNPNRRDHWSSKMKDRKKQKFDGWAIAKESGAKLGKGNYSIKLLFIPQDGRCRDLDNMLASLKNTLDGVAEGLGINDKQFRPIMIDVAPADKENPRTIMEIDA